ncbi:MAG: ABC transporter substrate-binding protein [Myxococcaceae bacterium]
MRLKLLLAVLLLGWAGALAGCRKDGGPKPLRLGFFLNITHAQALVGATDGTFERELAGVPLETKQFNAGPEAMEALLAGNIDASYVGPTPAVIAYVRSQGRLKVIAGATSGGASLVVRSANGPADLKGKKLGAPQIGNTQDVALRYWLKSQGLDASDRPGRDVTVLPLANPDILSLFQRKEIEGAWVPEPWASRMVLEAGGRILVDERTLWKDGEFPTTLLVATDKALKERRPQLLALVRAHVALTRRWEGAPAEFQTRVNDAFEKYTGKRLSDAVLRDSFSRLSLTNDPLEQQLVEEGRRTMDLGYLPSADIEGLVDFTFLDEVLGKKRS